MKVTSPSQASLQSLNRSRSRSHDYEPSSPQPHAHTHAHAQQANPFTNSLLQHKKNCLDFNISRQPHLALKSMKEMGMSLSNFSVTSWVRIEKFASAKFDETNVILAQSPFAEKEKEKHSNNNNNNNNNYNNNNNHGDDNNNNFIIAVKKQRLWFSFGADELVCESPLLEKSVWYHVGFVYDLPARTMAIYVNGERKALGVNKNPTSAPNKLFIGSYEDARCKLRGALSEFHIYLHALSTRDVRRLYEYDQCGYTQFTPFWIKSYNHADARLPRRHDGTDSEILSSHVSSENACVQANAMDVYLVSPPAQAAPDLSNLRSTFLRAGEKTVVPCRNPKCQEPMNLLAREATLRINIDSFRPQYTFNVAFACFRVSLAYSGPVLRLRRGNEFVEKDFFADAQGSLRTKDGQTLNSWSLGSDAFVSIWYTQTGDARFNAIQPEPSLQPRYLPGKKTIHFGENQYLRMNPATLAAGNASYSFILKHGRVEETQGGFFGVGRAEANQGVSLQRQKVNNAYRCYWIDSDNQFGGYSRGNTVFEVYDAQAGTRTAGVNGKVTNELRRVSPKQLAHKNPHDNSDAQAFLGRGLDYFSAKTPSLCGEIEYFFCTDAAMSLGDIQKLYRPGIRLYDYCVACYHCNQLVTVEQLRDVAQVCVRCNDHPRGVERGVEEVHFCYTHGVAQSHFLERVADAETHTFRLNRKIDERIARIDFQQREDLGLLNVRFVTNTARSSRVLGAPWRDDVYLSYSYTAPSASGGIAGLLFTTTEVDASPTTTPHARARRLSRVESISLSQKNSKKEKESEKSSDSNSNKSCGSNKVKLKVINGILLHNGKIFKVEPNPARPKPSFFDSLLCCLSPTAMADSVSLFTDASSPSLSLSGRYTIGVPNEPLTLRALSKKQSFLQLPAGQRAAQSRVSKEREKERETKKKAIAFLSAEPAEGFARKSSFADAKSIARKASLKGFNSNGNANNSSFSKKLSFADATPSVSETDTSTTAEERDREGEEDEQLTRRAKKSRHGQDTIPVSPSLSFSRDPICPEEGEREEDYGIAVEKKEKRVRTHSPPSLAPDRSDSPSLLFAHQLVDDDFNAASESEDDFDDDEDDFTKGYDPLLASSNDISDLYVVGGVNSSNSVMTPPSYASFSHNVRSGGALAIAEEFLWDEEEDNEESTGVSERQTRFLSQEEEDHDDTFVDYLDLYELTKEISRENQPSCFDFGFDRRALRDKFLLPPSSSSSSLAPAASKSVSCSLSRSESEVDSVEERTRFGMQFRELSLRDSALLSGSILRCESTDSEF